MEKPGKTNSGNINNIFSKGINRKQLPSDMKGEKKTRHRFYAIFAKNALHESNHEELSDTSFKSVMVIEDQKSLRKLKKPLMGKQTNQQTQNLKRV